MATRPSSNLPAPLPPRALVSLSSHLSTELLLLARIHYKNQSQHRLSLFWRRVDEVKRLGDKVQAGWIAWEAKGKEPGVSVEGNKGKKVKGGREVELRKLGTLLEKFHLSLPKLHVSLNQLVLLTHFLPLVTVLLGMTARLWGLSAGLYDHLRGIWSKDCPGKRPWRELDGGAKMQEQQEEDVSTTRASAPPSDRVVASTSFPGSRTPTPAPNPATPPPTLVPEVNPPEHGEVIQRRPPPSSLTTVGTIIPRQPSSLASKPTLPPSHLQDEPITYADSDSDSEPEPSPPPPKPKPVVLAAPESPPAPPLLPAQLKPLKRPTPTSINSPSLPKRPKIDPPPLVLPTKSTKEKIRKLDASTEGKKKVGSSSAPVVVKKMKKKIRRDEMDDIFG